MDTDIPGRKKRFPFPNSQSSLTSVVQSLGSSGRVASPRYWPDGFLRKQGEEGMEAGVLKTRPRGLHQETE